MNTGSINRPDARIALASQVPDLGQTFSNVLMNVQRMDAIREGRAQEGLRNRLLEAQVQQQEAAAPTKEQMAVAQLKTTSREGRFIAESIVPYLKRDDYQGAQDELERIRSNYKARGLDTRRIDGVIQSATDPNTLLSRSLQMIEADKQINGIEGQPAQFQKGATFTTRTDQGEAVTTSVFDPRTGKTRLEVTPLGQGQQFVSRLGETPEQQTSRQIELAKEKANISVDTETRKELSKAGIRLKTEPEITAAVTEAVSEAKAEAKIIGEKRSNKAAWNVYNAGISALSNALAGTETGPFIGLVPAITSSQQIADGAVAAMAPIVKQMFRAAGEGTFTDSDQKILIDMLPTRKDKKEAILSKLSNIDAIVRAKLGIGANANGIGISPEQETGTANKVIRFDAQGNIIQ